MDRRRERDKITAASAAYLNIGVQAATPHGTTFSESARLVVGADGPASRVAAEVQAEEYHAQPAQQGTAWIYWHDVPLTGAEIYLRAFEGIYAFPSSGGIVVGANWAIERFRALRRDLETSYFALLRRVAPRLAEYVMHASRADERFYLGATRNFFRTAQCPGWVLLGDAHYKKDPCTAQGITDAFCDKESDTRFGAVPWNAPPSTPCGCRFYVIRKATMRRCTSSGRSKCRKWPVPGRITFSKPFGKR